MADGIVSDGHMGALSATLTSKLGRRVIVHRVESVIRLPGGRQRKEIRYSLGIAGSNPPVFFGMTTNEVKQRMAMLLDLIQSGVVHVGAIPQDVRPGQGPDNQQSHSEDAPGGSAGGDYRGQVVGAQGSGEGEHQSPNDDEPY